MLFPFRDLPAEYDAPALESEVYAGLEAYKATLSDDRRCVLDRFEPVDVGAKVVGRGQRRHPVHDHPAPGSRPSGPLFLQIKEAGASVLEDHLEPSVYANHGRRVVEGQRLAQAESDIFLGWVEGAPSPATSTSASCGTGRGRPRSKRDAVAGRVLARLCGMTMARGHARTR